VLVVNLRKPVIQLALFDIGRLEFVSQPTIPLARFFQRRQNALVLADEKVICVQRVLKLVP